MTQPATTQPSRSYIQPEFSPATLAFGAVCMGGTAAVAAGLLSVSPLGGAIFGISSFFGNCLVHWICDQVNCCPDSPVFKIAQFALSTISGIAAALLLTTAMGFSITATTAVVLTFASISVAISTILTLGGCLCSSAIVSGIALGNRDPTTTIRP